MEEREVHEAFPYLFKKLQDRERISKRISSNMFGFKFQNDEILQAIQNASVSGTVSNAISPRHEGNTSLNKFESPENRT
jgi:hypothetical protein